MLEELIFNEESFIKGDLVEVTFEDEKEKVKGCIADFLDEVLFLLSKKKELIVVNLKYVSKIKKRLA